jgi:hypothetical protein
MKHDRSALLDEAREDEQPKQPVHLTSAVPMKPSTTLLPCPFCGGNDTYLVADEYGSGGQWVGPIHAGCSRCAVDLVDLAGESFEDAAVAWNRRAVEAASDQHGKNETDFGSRIEHLLAQVQRQRELLMQAQDDLKVAKANLSFLPLAARFEKSIAAIDALEPAEPVKGETL